MKGFLKQKNFCAFCSSWPTSRKGCPRSAPTHIQTDTHTDTHSDTQRHTDTPHARTYTSLTHMVCLRAPRYVAYCSKYTYYMSKSTPAIHSHYRADFETARAHARTRARPSARARTHTHTPTVQSHSRADYVTARTRARAQTHTHTKDEGDAEEHICPDVGGWCL